MSLVEREHDGNPRPVLEVNPLGRHGAQEARGEDAHHPADRQRLSEATADAAAVVVEAAHAKAGLTEVDPLSQAKAGGPDDPGLERILVVDVLEEDAASLAAIDLLAAE